MYSNEKFYKIDNELNEIHFPVRLGGFTGVNAPGEYPNNSDLNGFKIMLLMFIGSQDLYLGVYTDLIIVKSEKRLNNIFQLLTDLINHHVSEFLWFIVFLF